MVPIAVGGEVPDVFERSEYSLRFKSASLEDAFNASRRQTMCLNMSRVAAVGSLPILQQLGAVGLCMVTGDVSCIQTRAYFVSLCLLLALCLLWGTALRLQCFQQQVSFRTLEEIAVFMGMVFMVHFMELAKHTGSLFSDDDAELSPGGSVEYHQKSMAVAALGLDALVTCWHLALPVRWFVIVWMDVFVFTAFAISAYALRGLAPSDVEAHVILLFGCLVMGTSLGLRSSETKARIIFSAILDAKTLRAEAEFRAELQAERASPSRRGLGDPEAPDGVAALAEKDPTLATSTTRTLTLDDLKSDSSQEQWVLDEDQVQINEKAVLGEGSLGKVVAGEFRSTPVAVKCCKAETRPGSSPIAASILDELNVLCSIRHPNIAVFCGACFHSSDGGSNCKEFRLVLEKVAGVTLKSYILKLRPSLPTSPKSNNQVQIMKGICRALIYMHSRRPCVVHGDLKPSDVMVESRRDGPFPKLLDLGLSRRAMRNSMVLGDSMKYVAPEIFEPSGAPRPPVDVFAAGRLLFFVSSGREPRPCIATCIASSETGAFASCASCSSLSWAPTTNLLAAQRPLIETCCALDSAQRPNAREVYSQLAAWRAPADAMPLSAHSPRIPTFPIREEDLALDDADVQAYAQGTHGSPTSPVTLAMFNSTVHQRRQAASAQPDGDEFLSPWSSVGDEGLSMSELSLKVQDIEEVLEMNDALKSHVMDDAAVVGQGMRQTSGASFDSSMASLGDVHDGHGCSEADVRDGDGDGDGEPGAERDAQQADVPKGGGQEERRKTYLEMLARARERGVVV